MLRQCVSCNVCAALDCLCETHDTPCFHALRTRTNGSLTLNVVITFGITVGWGHGWGCAWVDSKPRVQAAGVENRGYGSCCVQSLTSDRQVVEHGY